MSAEDFELNDLPVSKTLIAFATRWGTQFGGVNSFNQDLISAIAAVGFDNVKTICVVLNASIEDQQSALNDQVHLVSLDLPNESVFKSELESLVWGKLQSSAIKFDCNHTVWLGHDRITGAIAIAASNQRGGRSALIHHMSYSRYESFAEKSSTAKGKENEQARLFENADIAMAVGPLLSDALSDIRNGQDVLQLVPGLPDIVVKDTPKIFKGFLSGRLSDDALRIKQAHLGVAAFADSIRQADENSGLPNTLRGENEPMLTLRGVEFENPHIEHHPSAEQELKLFAEKYAGRAFNLVALPFTTDRKELFDDLRSSSVAMMPSWHEGFGLVAWEAIAAGVPLIVSKKSGVYRLLRELNDGAYLSWLFPIDVAGSSNEPYFLDKDITGLSRELISIAKDPQLARQKAARLREALIGEFTWANCARSIVGVLGWQAIESEPRIELIDHRFETLSSSKSVDFINLPNPRWSANAGLSDSQLLRAEEAIIPFDPKREPFLNSQLNWATSQFPIAVRLLIGAGGVGKTRLALELCLRLKVQGWDAGFLSSECEVNNCEKLISQINDSGRPCCVVIDYAETRQVVLLAILRSLLKAKTSSAVRILLLARDGGEWWAGLSAKDASCEALLEGDASSGPFLLPRLHNSESERQEAYSIALNTFADLLGLTPGQHIPKLVDPHFAHPLYIQMAALMALRGERPRSAEALQRAVVNHEKRYWGRILSIVPGDNSAYERQAALLMTLATLANGIATERSIEKAWVAAGEKKSDLRRVFTSLSSLYPDRQGLQGLRPDLIGEALVAQSLLARNGSILLDVVIGGEKKIRQSSLTVLARLLRHRTELASLTEEVLTKKFILCIDEVISVCIETPSSLPEIVQRAYEKLSRPQKLQAAGVLEDRLHHEVLQLTALDVAVSKTIAERRAGQVKNNKEEDVAQYASAVKNLSIAYYRDGKGDEALSFARDSVKIYREIAQPKTIKFKSGFAESLINYSNRLCEQGQAEEALTIALQAVEIYRAINKVEHEGYNRELAVALNSYACRLDNLGRADESIVIAKECLDLYQKITLETSEDLRGEIASAFNNYANRLVTEGRDEEASAAAKETMNAFQELAISAPHRFQSQFAMSLCNYSGYLFFQEKFPEARDAIEQALEIYRQLVGLRPDRFIGDLASTLRNYGDHLSKIGEYEDGLAAYEESLNICQELAEVRYARFSTDLTFSYLGYADGLANTGDIEGALSAEREALSILDDLVRSNPGFYMPHREHCRLHLKLLQWLLSGEIAVDEVRYQAPVTRNASMQRGIEFHRLWLVAWTEQGSGLVSEALGFFSLLNSTQQRGAEAHMFLLVNLAEHLFGSGFIADSWREMSDRYRMRVGNKYSHWMIKAAEARGLTLL
ncbi:MULTISPECIES: tetratricopeptide repeat protein [unclassified Pseudomonas]|uniref:tetratricopeptide repeat protein n=1 Tax=unclassified Pseudomonas TaxID=196821 RepID=UPI001304E362|nr:MULTISPECIES: tetratricopeptide repeat protein [unclassified Pseudomonas]